MGNDSRFINHSCDPNCELQLWLVKGRMRIGIMALYDIEPEVSLSYDYQFETSEANIFKCFCNTAKCRGTMAPKRKFSANDVKNLSFAQRSKLLLEAKNRFAKSDEQLEEEEWSMSCTGRFLPGDKSGSAEVKNGPSKCMDQIRESNVFLPRNSRCVLVQWLSS
jgi:hypothetical protein